MLPHSRDLRKGRFSKSGHAYLVTTVARGRKPVFLEFGCARLLIKVLKDAGERGYASTIGFVVMPDHLHWLMVMEYKFELSSTVGFVKGTSAYQINKVYSQGEFSWQDGFHDHALRKKENIISAMRYIVGNP